MLRRRSTPLVAVAAALALSGCATFQDADVVAKVGDAELSQAELERRATSLGLVDNGRVNADAARNSIRHWIGLQLADRADIVDIYAQGPDTSGIVCAFLAPAPDVPTADAWVARLDDGETFDQLVVAEAPQVRGENSVCFRPAADIQDGADQLVGLSFDDPNRALVLGPQVFVLQLQSVGDVSGFQLLDAAAADEPTLLESIPLDAAEADIEIDPRFGTFDPSTFVIAPLG